ncbi:hypothetical protein D3C72_245350 [compost metagenome]
MDYRKATDQQLMVIMRAEDRATLRERVEAETEWMRRTRPQWERVQHRLKAVYR